MDDIKLLPEIAAHQRADGMFYIEDEAGQQAGGLTFQQAQGFFNGMLYAMNLLHPVEGGRANIGVGIYDQAGTLMDAICRENDG